MKKVIQCMYTCGTCHLKDVKVSVPAREADMSVVYWFKEVLTPTLVKHHGAVSPNCNPGGKFAEVKVPISKGEDAFIGGPVEDSKPQ